MQIIFVHLLASISNVYSTVFCFQSQINGIYDPCIGEEKSLKVIYEFRGILHEVVVKDNEILRIPLQCKYTTFPHLLEQHDIEL